MTMQFKKAERKQAKLRLGLSSPAGGGKTTGALKIAKGMGGRIAVIDTERGSASLYSHLTEFDTLDLNPPYSPERFIEAIQAAEKAGYDILIIDSATHEWDGSGGCLEINESLASAKYRGNTWSAWNETTPRHRSFLDAILQCKMHVICTLRSKTETVQEGKSIVKLGMKAIQREGIEYELTTVLEIAHGSHLASPAKDRTGLFKDPIQLNEDVGRLLMGWLNSGAVLVDEPKPAVATPQVQPPAEQPKPQQPAPVTPPAPDATVATVDSVHASLTITDLEAAFLAAKAHYANKRIDNAGMGKVADAVQAVATTLIGQAGSVSELDALVAKVLSMIANPQRQETIKATANAKREQLVPVTQQAEEEVDLFAA